MSREKPDSPHKRVIIDLNFPDVNSLNAGIAFFIKSQLPSLFNWLPTLEDWVLGGGLEFAPSHYS